jgi:sulfite reductase (NADPH) flavoprotein alpha-component
LFRDQHKACDFLYQDRLEQYKKDGILTKLDTAFSRGSEKKVYVQNKMFENSKELFEWLKNGVSFFVCGDKQRMAKDVRNASY